MSADRCQGWRPDLGAYVTGKLTAEEEVALRAHLDGCPACRSEATDLSAVARLLPLARPADLDDAPSPRPELREGVVDRVRAARRDVRRSRWRVRMAVAAAAIVGIAAGAIGATAIGGDDPPAPAGTPVSFTMAEGEVAAEARIAEKPWGSGISLTATGLRPGEVYAVWLERPDGSRVAAGTFRPGADRSIHCYMTAALAPHQATALGVSDGAGQTVLLAPAPA